MTDHTSFLNQVAQIIPNLYLSSFVGTSEQSIIKHGITCIITVCKEVPKVNLNYVESIKLDLLDKPNEQIDRYFDYVCDKINEVLNIRKGTCLVHCVAGISRSASMILAYLIKYHKMSLKDAHALVKSKRSFIRPNLGFWRQLIEYEKKLLGVNSVKFITTSFGLVPDVYEKEIQNMYGFGQQQQQPKISTSHSLILNIPNNNNNKNDSLTKSKNISSTAYNPFNFPSKLNRNAQGNGSTIGTYYTTTYNSSYGNLINRKDNF